MYQGFLFSILPYVGNVLEALEWDVYGDFTLADLPEEAQLLTLEAAGIICQIEAGIYVFTERGQALALDLIDLASCICDLPEERIGSHPSHLTDLNRDKVVNHV